MRSSVALFVVTIFSAGINLVSFGQTLSVIGDTGLAASYQLSQVNDSHGSEVARFSLALGEIETVNEIPHQWIHLAATKVDGKRLKIWLLSAGFPSPKLGEAQGQIARYIFQRGDSQPLEYLNRHTGKVVLPSTGAWPYLLPRSPNGAETEVFPRTGDYLGHRYVRGDIEESDTPAVPSNVRIVRLLPDVLVGIPINIRQKDETRRYDDSDYEYIPLTQDDYRAMIEEGINCIHAEPGQIDWLVQFDVFYWGTGGEEIPFPECLYDSQYLGSSLWLNEPAVVTRDQILRPKLRADEVFRKTISPQVAMAAFVKHYERVIQEGPPTDFINGLAARGDVDLGTMQFPQQNIHSWETMVSSAAYELSYDVEAPAAIVFEPPGDVGTRRTLPEMNMTYGCQIPVDGSNNLIDIMIGFMRGAARLTDKSWGISIYGEVDTADSSSFMTHAYDMGATRFFFWNNSRLACVPHTEMLALVHNLQIHAKRNPDRDLDRLRRAAEVAILLPPGYNLSHVYMGKGPLWGIGELNLERFNREGVKYREVMNNFFTEIERCIRLGVAFDLMWNLPDIKPEGYREVVRVREDGKVEVVQRSGNTVLDHARTPARPEGEPPQLTVHLSATVGSAPLDVSASAHVSEGSAPVYYTLGPDSAGIAHNTLVAWELYGPGEEDYRYLQASGPVRPHDEEGHSVDTVIHIERPGHYQLRVATVDLVGRTSVLWKQIQVHE